MISDTTALAVVKLLERMKEVAHSREVDRLSDEIRALVRREAAPRLGELENRAWPLAS